MAGFKVFENLQLLDAADLNSYLMGQVVARFTTTDQRATQLTAPVEGQLSYIIGTGLQIFRSGAWEAFEPNISEVDTLTVTDTLTLDAGVTLAAGSMLTWGGDTTLYRSAANTLKTDDNLSVGGGTLALGADATLYRFAADHLMTEDRVTIVRGAAADVALATQVAADTTQRLSLAADGKLSWGPGNAALDTTLYRNAADVLKTDDSFAVGANLTVAGTSTLTGAVTTGGDIQLPNAGRIKIGSDVNFYRSAASRLTVDSMMVTVRANVTDQAYTTALATDVNWRWYARMDGRLFWGDGAAALDTNLYRLSADLLRTDDSFYAGGWLRPGQYSTAGRPAAATAGVGAMVFDTTLGKPIWSDGAGWKDATGAAV